MAKTPEGIIQTYAQEQLKKHGCLVRKISYEGRRGCPDLLVLAPLYYWEDSCGGYGREQKTLFLEIKKDEKTQPAVVQMLEHERIRQHGGDVRIIGSKAQVDELVKELFPCD